MNLFNAKLSPAQVSAVFHQMSINTRLRLESVTMFNYQIIPCYVQVSMGCVDISGVPPEVAALALNRLQITRLCNTNITTQQLEAILRYESKSFQFGIVDTQELKCFVCNIGKCPRKHIFKR